MSLTPMDPECRKMNPVSKGFNRSFPKCFRLFPLWQLIYVLAISLKSIHPFYHNVPNRHAAAPRWKTLKPSRQAWNSLIFFTCVVPDISWKFHESPFTHFSITLLTNTDPGNRKINHGFNELTTTSQKCSSSFFVSCANFAEIFLWKSVYPFSRNIAKRHGFPWKHRKKKPSTQGVKRDTPEIFQIVPFIMPDNITFAVRRR